MIVLPPDTNPKFLEFRVSIVRQSHRVKLISAGDFSFKSNDLQNRVTEFPDQEVGYVCI